MNGAMCGEMGKLQRSLIQLWHISECVFCVCVSVCVVDVRWVLATLA